MRGEPEALQVEAVFPIELASAAAARRFARETLASWGQEELSDAVELLVSELVVNAIVHASSPATLRLRFDGHLLHVEIADESPVPPVKREASLAADGGRGLLILESMASAWGCEPTPEGKIVWFDLVGRGCV